MDGKDRERALREFARSLEDGPCVTLREFPYFATPDDGIPPGCIGCGNYGKGPCLCVLGNRTIY